MTEDDLRISDSLGTARPLYATQPDPDAPHELDRIGKVARLLGTPLLPWQRYVARVATERTPDGAYRYPVVLLSVPRQSGKTTLFRTLLAARCLSRPHVKAFATAQTGKDATERLFELSDAIETSRIGKTIKVRRAAGTSRITFHNGSKIQAFSPTPESLHGYTPNIVFLDEIFSFTQLQGDLLMGAITPAMQTVKDRQLLMCSTKGTQDSTFLNGWIEKGRQATQDPDSQIAYFEWSLADDLDPFDPGSWDFHPGLAGGLITKADIQQASETISKGEFTSAYMNRPTQTADTLFSVTRWNALKGTLSTPTRSEVAVAYEVAHDRSRAAVVAAWRHEGQTHVKVIRTGTGTDWLPSTLERIREARPRVIGADRYAQNLVIADQLNSEAEFPLHLLKPEGIKTGSAAFKAHIEDGTITHDGHARLTAAVSTAQSRPMGEGWALSHKSEPKVMAALVASRLLDEAKPESRPQIYFDTD